MIQVLKCHELALLILHMKKTSGKPLNRTPGTQKNKMDINYLKTL